jgi:hypothetical protein
VILALNTLIIVLSAVFLLGMFCLLVIGTCHLLAETSEASDLDGFPRYNHDQGKD